MSNFEQLYNLPIHYNLLEVFKDFNIVLKDNQICLTSIPGEEHNCYLGCGSLYYDWDNKRIIKDDYGNEKIVVDPYKTPMQDRDFSELCTIFKGTTFEDIYYSLKKSYNIGRVRLMKLSPRSTLTWHVDDTIRLHYPIKTQDGCFMIINDEVKYLPENTWWKTNTLEKHTALNASKEDRIHLVVNIL
jgi:hypothetical protein